MKKSYQPTDPSSIPGYPYPVYMVTNMFNVEMVDDRILIPNSKYQVPVIAIPETLNSLPQRSNIDWHLEFNTVLNLYVYNRILSA